MQKKVLFSVLIILGIILLVLTGVYFFRQNKPVVNFVENAAQNKTPVQSQQKTESGVIGNNQPNTGQLPNKLVTDDFEMGLLAGWIQATPAIGTSAMAVNANESISDPAAQKINFKSYFAVSYDVLQGKNISEYLQIVKSGLRQTIPGVVFTKEQDMTVNGKSAHAIEAELSQQGANFKILMAVVKGQGDDVWVISFNTLKSSWDGYRETFYSIVNSFSLKK